MGDARGDVQAYLKSNGLLNPKRTYFWNGENAVYLGKGSDDGIDRYEGLGEEGRTEDAMRGEAMAAYNNDLSLLIAEAAKSGGILTVKVNGGQWSYEVTAITKTNMDKRITIEALARVTH